jgi:hypothetical protein
MVDNVTVFDVLRSGERKVVEMKVKDRLLGTFE